MALTDDDCRSISRWLTSYSIDGEHRSRGYFLFWEFMGDRICANPRVLRPFPMPCTPAGNFVCEITEDNLEMAIAHIRQAILGFEGLPLREQLAR